MSLTVAGAMLLGSAIAGGSSLIGNLFSNKANKDVADQNLDLQQKNLDYQKAVQQRIFEREDTAIQRRKDDLMKAGLNPYFAAQGNGAGAGSVVSTTAPQYGYMPGNDIQKIFGSVGAAVDMYKALQQVKQEEIYTKYMQLQNISLSNNLFNQWNIDLGGGNYGFLRGDRIIDKGYTFDNGFLKTPMGKLMHQNVIDAINQGSILQTKRDFAVSDKIEGYIMDGIDALLGGSNAARGWYRDYGNQHFNGYTPHGYTDSFESHRGGWSRTRNYN